MLVELPRGPEAIELRSARCSDVSFSSLRMETGAAASSFRAFWRAFAASFSCGGLFRQRSYPYTLIQCEWKRLRAARAQIGACKGRSVDAKATPPPLCFVLMPFGRKTDATGRDDRFRRRLPADHRAGGARGRARSDPGRRGEDRGRHPQADVRAADALRLRRRRHHRRQSQRLLRARHPARDAAAQRP